QRWQALPATLRGLNYPELDRESWHAANAYETGVALLYENNDVGAADWFVASARAMNTVFGFATILLIGAWAWILFGRIAAVFSTAFAALSPTLLAHSGLAT